MNSSTKSDPAPGDRRRAPRMSVMLAAEVERGGICKVVRLTDLSEKGSAVAGALPDKRSLVTLRRGGIAVRTRVAWVAGDRGGLDFDGPVEPAQMLPRIAVPPARHPPACRRAALSPRPSTWAERQSITRCANLLGISPEHREG